MANVEMTTATTNIIAVRNTIIEDNSITLNIELSKPITGFNADGSFTKVYTERVIKHAVLTPSICTQLRIHLDGENYRSAAKHAMADVKAFCTDVYKSVAAYGYVSDKGHRVVRLINAENKSVYYTLENGCPQQVNPAVHDLKFIRRLTLNKDMKMSKKLWSTTDWLLYL